MNIRAIRPEDWQAYKQIRLKALLDTPIAFGGTYDNEVQFSDEQWQKRAERCAKVGDSSLVFSEINKEIVGMSGCYINQDDKEACLLYTVWLAPAWRGIGVAEKMIQHLEQWAIGRCAIVMNAGVTEINDRALSFYSKLGFADSGERHSMPWDPAIHEIVMRKKLN